MQEMDVEAVDGGLVLAPVQYRLAAAPVVAVTSVIDQRLDLGERGALGPVVDCLRGRPAGLVDAAVEVLEIPPAGRRGSIESRLSHSLKPNISQFQTEELAHAQAGVSIEKHKRTLLERKSGNQSVDFVGSQYQGDLLASWTTLATPPGAYYARHPRGSSNAARLRGD
jgi:hypothetical protein